MIVLEGYTDERAREIADCYSGGPTCRCCREIAAEREREAPASEGEVQP